MLTRKANVCLVYPPFYNDSIHSVPPIGILRLAAFLEQAGTSVFVRDFIYSINAGLLRAGPSILDDVAKDLLHSDANVFGFSTQATTVSPSIGIAERIKAIDPSRIVIFGGYGASFCSTELLERFHAIDYVVKGEGEQTLLELISAVETSTDIQEVKGVAYRDPSGHVFFSGERALISDINSLPPPAYHLVPSPRDYVSANRKKQQLNRPFPIDSGRGCSFSCNFCSSCLLFNRRVRSRSPDNIVNEIRFLRDHHDVRHFLLTYDLFNVKEVAVEDFCRALIESRLDVEWECRARIDLMTPLMAKLMYEAGCRRILVGLESGSERILRYMKKPLDLAATRQNIAMITAAQLKPIFSFVVGFPGETPSDFDHTFRLSLYCRLHEPATTTIHLATPLPGTSLHRETREMLSLRYLTGDLSSGIGFVNGQMLAEDMDRIRRYPDIFSSFYNIDNPVLPIDELFFAYRVWNILVSFYKRTLYQLCDSGTSAWELLVAFRHGVSTELARSVHDVVGQLDRNLILLEFGRFLSGLPAVRAFGPVSDCFRLEQALAEAYVKPISRLSRKVGVRLKRATPDALRTAKLRPEAIVVELSFDVSTQALLRKNVGRIEKYYVVAIPRGRDGFRAWSISRTTGDYLNSNSASRAKLLDHDASAKKEVFALARSGVVVASVARDGVAL